MQFMECVPASQAEYADASMSPANNVGSIDKANADGRRRSPSASSHDDQTMYWRSGTDGDGVMTTPGVKGIVDNIRSRRLDEIMRPMPRFPFLRLAIPADMFAVKIL